MKLKQDNWIKQLNTSKEADTVGRLIDLVNDEYSTSLEEFNFTEDLQDEKKTEYQDINAKIDTLQENPVFKEIDLTDVVIKKITAT